MEFFNHCKKDLKRIVLKHVDLNLLTTWAAGGPRWASSRLLSTERNRGPTSVTEWRIDSRHLRAERSRLSEAIPPHLDRPPPDASFPYDPPQGFTNQRTSRVSGKARNPAARPTRNS